MKQILIRSVFTIPEVWHPALPNALVQGCLLAIGLTYV